MEERRYLGLSNPRDHTTLAFRASLASALSTNMALNAKILQVHFACMHQQGY